MNDHTLSMQIEALLFALGKPLARSELAKLLIAPEDDIERALTLLHTSEGRGIVLVDDGVVVELRSAPSTTELIERVRREEYARDIGRAGLEVLAALLYRGPLSRSEIDFVRGVNSSQTIRTLTTRGFIRKVPRDSSVVGRISSYVFEVTTEVLAAMGATHPRDLPDYEQVQRTLYSLEASYKQTSGETI